MGLLEYALEYIPGVGTVLKYERIKNDYLLNKKKSNGDPYAPQEAENIAMEKLGADPVLSGLSIPSLKLPSFPSIKLPSWGGSKALNFGIKKISKSVSAQLTKHSMTWEEYYNSPNNPFIEPEIQKISSPRPQNRVTQNEFKGEKGVGSNNKPTTSENLYHPATNQVNYDPKQRIVNQGKTSPQGGSTQQQPPVSARPFNREQPFRTPNAEAIHQTLYGKISESIKEQARNEIKGYARDKTVEYGKVLKGRVEKNETLYKLGSKVKNYASSAWRATSKVVTTIAKATVEGAKWVAAQAVTALQTIGSVAVAAAHAIAAAAIIAATAVAHAVSWAVGAAIALFFCW